MTTVRMVSGKEIDLLNPDPKMIDIEDIAHHLAKLDRYNGASPKFHYSVGQHCLYVAQILPAPLQLWGLLHDATEALCGDVVSPLKALIPAYKEIEEGISRAVCERFGLACLDYAPIKAADKAVMAAEMLQLFGWKDLSANVGVDPAKIKIKSMSWKSVKKEFLATYARLTEEQSF